MVRDKVDELEITDEIIAELEEILDRIAPPGDRDRQVEWARENRTSFIMAARNCTWTRFLIAIIDEENVGSMIHSYVSKENASV